MKKTNNNSLTSASSKPSKMVAITTDKSSYSKVLAVLLSGYLITACSSVQVNDDPAITDTQPSQEQNISVAEPESNNDMPEQSQDASATSETEVETQVESEPQPDPAADEIETTEAETETKTEPAVSSNAENVPSDQAAEAAAESVAMVAAVGDTAGKAETVSPELKVSSTKAETPIIAKSTPSAQDAKAAVAAFAITSKQMPKDAMTWTLERNWDPKNPKRCFASSPTFQIYQHGFSTQVWLDVIDHQLYVNTTLNIDIEKAGVGIKAGNGSIEKFSSQPSSTSAIWSGDLLSALQSYKHLDIVIGGEVLGDRTQTAEIKLDGLKAIYSEYLNCKD